MRLLALLLAVSLPAAAFGQAGYKYKDAEGHWVFTDQPPPKGVSSDSFKLAHEETKLDIHVERADDAESLQLVGVNECLCTISLNILILESEITGLTSGGRYQEVLEPRSRKALVRIARPANPKANLLFQWQATLGSPYAQHKPPQPYRVPFGIGSSFKVTQAFPSKVTHTAPESAYAIDFGLPDGTPVYAARDGLVINARHDFFKGGADPVMFDQANVVEILHDDGTIGVYAHLHWDSIQVRIGQRVQRGQHIADSGNTGFSSGPHLHFAVIMNGGDVNVSVPVEFKSAGDAAVTAEDHETLTAY